MAPADQAKVAAALKGQVVAVARKADGKPLKATLVQTAFALDDLYAYEAPLGSPSRPAPPPSGSGPPPPSR